HHEIPHRRRKGRRQVGAGCEREDEVYVYGEVSPKSKVQGPKSKVQSPRSQRHFFWGGRKMAKILRFEDIEAWQRARELTRKVYNVSKTGFFAKDFGLRDQIQRASV